MTISLVETQKSRFAYIDASELYERKALVTTSQDRLGRAKTDMVSDAIKNKMLEDERAKAVRRMKANNNKNNNHDMEDDRDVENTAFIAGSQAQSSLMMQQQDETQIGRAHV